MDRNKLSSIELNFSDLVEKYLVFRDPNSDFKMSMKDEYHRLNRETYNIEWRHKDKQFLGDELIDIEYHMDLCEKMIEKLQIELRNCILILEKFKEVNVNYGGKEIKIHYVTYQIKIIDNFIEVHRNSCREFTKKIEMEPSDNKISNLNYSTLPENDPSAFKELCSKLRYEGLILDRAKDYCGYCLSQVDIKLATHDFLGLQSQLLIEIDDLEKSSESLKLQKVQIVENRKLKLDAMPQHTLRDEIPKNQLVVAREYKNEILNRTSTHRIILYFGGYKMSDGKLFVGTGSNKTIGEDSCIEYSNWILIDTNGLLVESSYMSAEELAWSESTILQGPGGRYPIISIN